MSPLKPHQTDHASVVAAVDSNGLVALLKSEFPEYGGEFAFLPGGRQEHGENAEDCARRELREESGITAAQWHHLGTYALQSARNGEFLLPALFLAEQHLNRSA